MCKLPDISHKLPPFFQFILLCFCIFSSSLLLLGIFIYFCIYISLQTLPGGYQAKGYRCVWVFIRRDVRCPELLYFTLPELEKALALPQTPESFELISRQRSCTDGNEPVTKNLPQAIFAPLSHRISLRPLQPAPLHSFPFISCIILLILM